MMQVRLLREQIMTCENMISQEYCGHRYLRDEPTPWGTNSH